MRIAVRYIVRSMRLSDIPQVMEIERESFPTMWPQTAYKRELQQNRLAHYIVIVQDNSDMVRPSEPADPQAHGRLGRFFGEIRHMFQGYPEGELPPPEQRPELVLGVIGVWLLPDEAHIVTVAVRESHRRSGIGERLLISAIELAQQKRQPLVTLECRPSNYSALALYEKYGFQRAGLRPRYYSDNQEDAVILTAASVTGETYGRFFEERKREHNNRWGLE